MKRKLQVMRISQQLNNKKNVVGMKICTMNMTWRTTLLQHTQNGILATRWILLDIVSRVPEMQLSYSWWVWKASRKILKLHMQVVVYYNMDHGQNWAWSCRHWSAWTTWHVCSNLKTTREAKINLYIFHEEVMR